MDIIEVLEKFMKSSDAVIATDKDFEIYDLNWIYRTR